MVAQKAHAGASDSAGRAQKAHANPSFWVGAQSRREKISAKIEADPPDLMAGIITYPKIAFGFFDEQIIYGA